MFIDPKIVKQIPIEKLKYNQNLPIQNIDIETLVKLSQTNIPSDLPLVSTTYTQTPNTEEQIIILLSNILLKIRKIQGLKKVPTVFYHEIKTQELLFLYTTYKKFNIINPLEEAIILHQLNKEGYTHKQIAQVLGVSRSYITNKIRLTVQPKELITALINGDISEGHAKIIMGIEDKVTKLNILDIVLNEGLSVKQTAKLVQNFKGYSQTPNKIDPKLKNKLETVTKKAKELNIPLEILVPKRKKNYITKLTILIKEPDQLDTLSEVFKT